MKRLALLALIVLCPPDPALLADGGKPPAWGELEPGPHSVGVRVVHAEDRTRTYWPPGNHIGQKRSGPVWRPMQVTVWYPATIDPASDQPLRFRDYVELHELALGVNQQESLRESVARDLRNDFFGRFFRPDGPSEADLQLLLRQPTAAYRDAPYVEERFPVVIHSGMGPATQSVLLEYLASHGYVVVAIPMLGSDAGWFNRGSGTLEWWQETARDIAWLRAFASELPNTDVSRTAVVGMTASAGVLEQVASMQLSAIVGMDATYRELMTETPGFEPARVRIPILDIVSTGRTRNQTFLETLVFSDRWIVRLDEVDHGDFYQFRRLTGHDAAVDHSGYTALARLTRRFLDSLLKEDDPAAPWSAQSIEDLSAVPVTVEHWAPLPAIPSAHELILMVREGRLDEATRAYANARREGHGPWFAADQLRTAAVFRLYDDGDPEGARAAFEILLDAYPNDIDGLRYLARAHAASDDPEEARAVLNRALEIISSLELSDAERVAARERIERELVRLDR